MSPYQFKPKVPMSEAKKVGAVAKAGSWVWQNGVKKFIPYAAGMLAGGAIVDKAIRDPLKKEQDKADRNARAIARKLNGQDVKVPHLASLHKLKSEALIRTIQVGAPLKKKVAKTEAAKAKAAGGALKIAKTVGGGLLAGAGFTALDRYNAFSSLKKNKDVAYQRAALDLKKKIGADAANKIITHADKSGY